MPSPPDKVLPSHHHTTLEGLSTPTEPLNLLTRATSRSGMPSLAPSLRTSSTSYLLPFTFGSQVCLSLEGEVAHPLCAGGLTPPPQKCTPRKHQPCHICQHHGPWAPAPGLPIYRSTFFAGGNIGPMCPNNLLQIDGLKRGRGNFLA